MTSTITSTITDTSTTCIGHRSPVTRLLPAILLLTTLAACARVGAPLPPLKREPPPVADLTAAQEGGELVLRGRLPEANSDKSPIQGYRRFEVAGVERPSGTTAEAFEGVSLLPMASWEDAALASCLDMAKRRFEVRIPILDRFGHAEGMLAVRVRFQNEREHWSPWSGLLLQPVGRVAMPPENLAARQDAEGIHFQWVPAAANFDGTHPAAADGVQFLRRELPQGAVEPAGEATAPATTFTVTDFRSDARYAFAAAAFRRIGQTVIRGGLTPWVEVDTKDIYPPPAPVGLAIVVEEGKIRLIWDPVASPDLAGYLVFRRDGPGQESRQQTPDPVTDPTWTDPAANPAEAHWYRVVAVDSHGNRSQYSEEAAYEPAKGTE